MCSLHILILYLLLQAAVELTAEFQASEWGRMFGFKSTYNNTAIGYVETQVDSNTTQHSFRVSQTTKITVRFVFYSAWIRLRLPKSLF